MCGICGFNWEDKQLVRDMAFVISHRGPDQEGYFSDKNISLGHKRLSIIDLSERGRQPMHNEDNSIWIVFNGEIYNFQEIRPDLEKKGHKFLSDTDTEVIIHAYEEYGYDCLKLFNGMFAFAIWDSNKRELFIARDRIGIKPLYYYYKNNEFVFGSEIKSILQYSEIKRELDENCLKQIIYYAYPINGRSLMKDIVELRPGHYILLKGNKLDIRKYWDLAVNETNKSESFYIKNVTNLLSNSVKRRLISDVPLGIALSGGIDSSVVVAMASKLKEEPIKTFTIGFEGIDSEFNSAKMVAEHCKTDHMEIHLGYKDFIGGMLKALWYMEFPISRPAMVPVYYLYESIRERLTVSLAGEGSDEIFAGYNRYDAYTKLPPITKVKDKTFYEELKKKINMPFNKKVRYISSGVFNEDMGEFFSQDILDVPEDINVYNTFGPLLRNTKNDGSQLNKALLYELKTEIPYFHCNKLDRLSMANSHEVRVPYLDYTVVEFALTIPSKYKFYGTEKKIILQKVAKPLLPKKIVKRRKLPMIVPLTDFFENEFIEVANNILSESNIQKRSYYKIPGIRKLVADIKEKRRLEDKSRVTSDNSYRQLLFLTNLELWIKLFIENDNLRKPDLSINAYL